jgi:hypothetical protein
LGLAPVTPTDVVGKKQIRQGREIRQGFAIPLEQSKEGRKTPLYNMEKILCGF